MPVPTGTATPWREAAPPDEGGVSVYIRPGRAAGPSELLAEQLRMDGVVVSLGPALGRAAAAELSHGWYGVDQDGSEVLCDRDGWTESGGLVGEPLECVVARVDVRED